MKNNKISENARKAFENFKEEIAKEMGIDTTKAGKNVVKKIKENFEKRFSNLGRS
ncbi:small, acid-soluble spore protein, alpha/beta type [Caloranaerobacter ferrireducens]|uniref:small, acid-soluble spore protein, alpha/beta type n=1 Tax=Caloranaerobacter ferrireducens TaxID=1323370 RepID=UPI00159F17E8|nr:small, acid-soluble spore protein, alpha/beta type [Caloranaerobacter ferrireducens]